MTSIISVLSQKGGVGKSTIARLLACELARKKTARRQARVLLADLDTGQQTSATWFTVRQRNGHFPEFYCDVFRTPEEVFAVHQDYDYVVIDGAPHASRLTLKIAARSDLVVIPTGASDDDIRPAVRLALDLANNRQNPVSPDSICFVMSRINGSANAAILNAYDELSSYPFTTLDHALPEQTAFYLASNEGLAVSQTRFRSLNAKARAVSASILAQLDDQLQRRVA